MSSSPEVDEFCRLAGMLIEAAGGYAESGKYDANNDGMMRRLRVVTNALQAALANVNIMPPINLPPTAMAAPIPIEHPPTPMMEKPK